MTAITRATTSAPATSQRRRPLRNQPISPLTMRLDARPPQAAVRYPLPSRGHQLRSGDDRLAGRGTGDGGAVAGRGTDGQTPAQGGEPVAHALQARAGPPLHW